MSIYSSRNRTVFNAKFIGPGHRALSTAIQRVKPATTTILRLLLLRGPYAVFRGVWAFIILPLYAVLNARSLTHVSVEVFKGIPALAYRYAPGAVAGIAWIVGVIAALAHTAPRFMFKGLCHAVSFACLFLRHNLPLQTPTRFGSTIPEGSTQDTTDSAARTPAPPHKAVFERFIEGNDSPAAKLFTRYIFAGHNCISVNAVRGKFWEGQHGLLPFRFALPIPENRIHN